MAIVLPVFCNQVELKKINSMVSVYHSHKTRTVTMRGKEKAEPIFVLDYNLYQSYIMFYM
jgi:hypothetical protein